jgi:zinc/manganese transport system permease protein
LLFTTVDDNVAAARGLPVRAIGLGFLAVTGVTTAEATQVVGALLLLGLLAAPAAAAHRLAHSPFAAIALAGALAIASMWGGLALAYAIPSLPPSTAIVTIAVAIYYASAMLA